MRSRGGQAMIEFVVAIVVVIVLFAGLLQIGTLGFNRSRCMLDARHEASRRAMDDTETLSGPHFIREWTPGADTRTYSVDDEWSAEDPGGFSTRLVGYGRPDDLERARPGNPVSPLFGDPFPAFAFGLVHGDKERRVPLIPAIRDLVYRADYIDVKADAWLVWTEGIY